MSDAVRRDSAATSLTDLLRGLPRPFLQAYWLPCTAHITAVLRAVRSQVYAVMLLLFTFCGRFSANKTQ
jgi:hypothetical protein